MPQLRKNRKRIYSLIMWNQVICKLTEKKLYRQILIISPKNQIYLNPFI